MVLDTPSRACQPNNDISSGKLSSPDQNLFNSNNNKAASLPGHPSIRATIQSSHTTVVNPLLLIPTPLVLFKVFSNYLDSIFPILSQYEFNTNSIPIQYQFKC